MISDCWTVQGWNLYFRRLLNDWEIERVAKLLEEVGDFAGTNTDNDVVRWSHSKNGIFTVGRAYKKECNSQSSRYQSSWKNIWRTAAPTKVICCTWLVIRKACLTHEVLRKKRKIILPWCSLCGKTRETNSHLFLHCTFTAEIWSMFLNYLEVKWTMPEHTTDLLSCWIRRGGSKRQKTWWNLIPHCIWWTVWKKRNSRNFEDISNSIHKVKWNCIVSLYFWCKEIGLEDSDQLLELLGSL
ncbi:hypothetical protein MTR67_019058 [Solanum verrucosum]|uniref:Reverse transcriptase zinc-binding domain-containing protein n=1 Tax=Solanum verrucosum TaxID=315347 RepID=A0AAF0TUC7_SOLVR|nr:hypothetical protein MTR67_019058 [Solanum verrucosum]